MRSLILLVATAGAAAAQGLDYQSRLLAIGFDDFRKSDFTLIQPLFEKYGAHATFNRIGTAQFGRTALANMAKLEATGSEIGDHTWAHFNTPFGAPLMNGQDPSAPEGGQVPFPSNAQLRDDRGDGRNAFGIPLDEPVERQLLPYTGRKPIATGTWRKLTDADCQAIRNYYSVYANCRSPYADEDYGMLDLFDRLSNRYLGTSGSSRGSWDPSRGCYTNGVFTGCRTSANHEIWERIVALTQAAYRDAYRADFGFSTWSWPGVRMSPFYFHRGDGTYFDAACTKPANLLAKFPSSRLKGADGQPLDRSWTDVLRAAGYVMTHDTRAPGKMDGTAPTMMSHQLFANASFSRRDALAYPTESVICTDDIPTAYPETFFTNGLGHAARDMYDGGGIYRTFIEALRHDTACGLVSGEVIDSADTFSERQFFEQVLAYCQSAGIRVVSKREAYDHAFGTRFTVGNLIRNPGFRNTAAEFLPDARTVPPNPDGYRGDCRVTKDADGRTTLVAAGETGNLLYGVPTGCKLVYSVSVRGKGAIRIRAVKNSDDLQRTRSRLIAEISVDSDAFVRKRAEFVLPDNPAAPFEPRWEGLGEKIMALEFVYSKGLSIKDVKLCECSHSHGQIKTKE